MNTSITIGTTTGGKPFRLPLDLVTDSLAILARKGAGKTYCGKVWVEDLLANHIQTVVIDPLDVWWGLRLSSDGKQPGENIVIFGGSHADIPITEHLGNMLADVIVDRGINAILVLDHLSTGASRRFVADFCNRLFERKSAQSKRTPLHLIIDEADVFAPQRPPPDAMVCLGAVDRLVRRGRSRGLGTMVISQRSAVLSKDVLTQTEVLIALQVTSPHDREALTEWIRANTNAEKAKEFLDSLAGLQQGEAWFWSPTRLKLLAPVKIRTSRTYDSSYTPKIGERRKTPVLKPTDIAHLGKMLADVAEEAKANDPKALKERIRNLEQQLAAKPKQVSGDALDAARATTTQRVAGTYEAGKLRSKKAIEAIIVSLQAVVHGLEPAATYQHETPAATPPQKDNIIPPYRPKEPRPRSIETNGSLPKAERLILKALAQYPDGRTKIQIAILTSYSHRGGAFNNALSHLRTQGYITGSGDHIKATESGWQAVGPFEPLPTGGELLAQWRNHRLLGKAERLILDVLSSSLPKTKADLALSTGYESTGGSFNNALSKLRTLELIEGRGTNGLITLSSILRDS